VASGRQKDIKNMNSTKTMQQKQNSNRTGKGHARNVNVRAPRDTCFFCSLVGNGRETKKTTPGTMQETGSKRVEDGAGIRKERERESSKIQRTFNLLLVYNFEGN
jgi:hypothetical protein